MIAKKIFKQKLNMDTMEYEDVSIYMIDGKEVSKKEYEKAIPSKPIGDFGTQTNWEKPVVSYGAACVPKRIKEYEAHLAKHGCPTDFTTHRGRPIFRSRQHQLQALKIMKMNNNDETRG